MVNADDVALHERFPRDADAAPVPIEAVADARLLELVEQRFSSSLVRTHHATTYLRELPCHLNPEDWRTGFLAVHEGGAPMDVREALHVCTPQALLRDAHRPGFSQSPVMLEFVELPLDPGGRNAMAELRQARTYEPVQAVPRSVDLVRESQAEWQAFVRGPWLPMLSDDEPRRDVFVAIEPSLNA